MKYQVTSRTSHQKEDLQGILVELKSSEAEVIRDVLAASYHSTPNHPDTMKFRAKVLSLRKDFQRAVTLFNSSVQQEVDEPQRD